MTLKPTKHLTLEDAVYHQRHIIANLYGLEPCDRVSEQTLFACFDTVQGELLLLGAKNNYEKGIIDMANYHEYRMNIGYL